MSGTHEQPLRAIGPALRLPAAALVAKGPAAPPDGAAPEWRLVDDGPPSCPAVHPDIVVERRRTAKWSRLNSAGSGAADAPHLGIGGLAALGEDLSISCRQNRCRAWPACAIREAVAGQAQIVHGGVLGSPAAGGSSSGAISRGDLAACLAASYARRRGSWPRPRGRALCPDGVAGLGDVGDPARQPGEVGRVQRSATSAPRRAARAPARPAPWCSEPWWRCAAKGARRLDLLGRARLDRRVGEVIPPALAILRVVRPSGRASQAEVLERWQSFPLARSFAHSWADGRRSPLAAVPTSPRSCAASYSSSSRS